MAGVLDALKIIALPALIAAVIYVVTAYAVVPLIRRHRERYSQYMPLDSILDSTSAVRSRITTSVGDLILRVFERRRRAVQVANDMDSQDGDNLTFGDEEGEAMAGFDISRRGRPARAGDMMAHSDARLSRDLEEGFMDSSDEDDGRLPAGRRTG